jgi:hypothetical protein
MKAKVSKKLNGVLMLPSVSVAPLIADQDIEITDEIFFNQDVQNALNKGYITFNGPIPKRLNTHRITNISNSIISFGNLGSLRHGESILISTEQFNDPSIQQLIANNKISITLKGKIPEPPKETLVESIKNISNQKMSHKKAKTLKQRMKEGNIYKEPPKDKQIKKLHEPDQEYTDIDNPPVITFVDHQQAEERLKNHPFFKNK